jgi:2-keto-3-deoxy-6-phosphogluconate aldolase
METHTAVSMRAAHSALTLRGYSMTLLQSFLDRLPLVAILRGVTPEEVVAVGDALVDAGFAIIEVPLNSPRPMESIQRLHAKFGQEILVGAGTVMSPAQVKDVGDAGGELIVMPHGDVDVVRAAKSAGLSASPASRRRRRGSPRSPTAPTRSSSSRRSCSRPPC